MAKVLSIQKGTATVGTLPATTSINSVTSLAQSVLYITAYSDGAHPKTHNVAGELTATDTITWYRGSGYDTGISITVEWTVVEYDSSVAVQRGSYTYPNESGQNPASVSINSITTLSRGFVLANVCQTGTVTGFDDFWQYHLSDASTLHIETGDKTQSGYYTDGPLYWQVAACDDFAVQQVAFSWSTSQGGTEDSATATTTYDGSTFVIASHYCSTNVQDPKVSLVRARYASDTAYAVRDTAASTAVDVLVQVVEETGGSGFDLAVQTGTSTMTNTNATQDITISPVIDTSKAFGFLGGIFQRTGATDQSGSSPNDLSMVNMSVKLTSTTNLRMQRHDGTNAVDYAWQVLDYNQREGTLSQTLGNATLSANAGLTVGATLAQTLGNVALSANAELIVGATLAETLANVTPSASGSVEILSTCSETLGDITPSANGSVVIAATLSETLADTTLAASADVTIPGTLGVTLADVALSGSADLVISGTLGVTLGDTTLPGSADVTIPGTVSQTLGDVTISGSANVISGVTGTASEELGGIAINATGQLTVGGTLGETFGDVSASATASIPVVSTSAVTLGDTSLSSTAGITINGTLAITLGDVVLGASGGDVGDAEATFAQTLADVLMSGTVYTEGELVRFREILLEAGVTQEKILQLTILNTKEVDVSLEQEMITYE